MIDTDKYEGHTEGRWLVYDRAGGVKTIANKLNDVDWELIADAPLLLAEVKRLQSEPTVTVDDYHKMVAAVRKGHLYVTVRFPDGDEYVGLVEKWEGEEE